MSVDKEEGITSKKLTKESIPRGENSKPEYILTLKKMAMKITNHT